MHNLEKQLSEKSVVTVIDQNAQFWFCIKGGTYSYDQALDIITLTVQGKSVKTKLLSSSTPAVPYNKALAELRKLVDTK